MERLLLPAVLLLVVSSCGPALVTSGEPDDREPATAHEAAEALVKLVDGASVARPAKLAPGEVAPRTGSADGTEGAADAGDGQGAEADPWQQALAHAQHEIASLARDDPQRTKPDVADDPVGLAAQLELAERTLRNDEIGPPGWAAAGHLQQRAIRKLVERPEWDDRVRHWMSDELVGFVDLHVAAGRDLVDMHPTPDYGPGEWPAPPPWRIVEPAPMDELKSYYEKSAEAVGIHWSYLAAINLIETRMGRIDGVSWAGAQGPMQFMPGTWDWVGAGNVHSDHDAIMAAGRLLAENGAPGDMPRAIFGYNNDVRYARAVQRYAEAMQAEPRALRGYYYWQVYTPGPDGARLLPIGFDGR